VICDIGAFEFSPLRITTTTPTNGQTGVDRDANIKAKFSEKMMKSSINQQTVYLSGPGGCGDLCSVRIPASVNYNVKKKVAILNPSSRLPANTAVVEGAGDSDSLAVKNRVGNEMAVDYTWTFTTGAS
jgi:hypothetical protein